MDSERPPPPAAPTHIFRSHSSAISALSISDDNERIYSGDASGKVTVTSTRTLRAIAIWNAHTDGILGIEEWGKNVITQGRDNKLHLWTRMEELPSSTRLGGSAALPSLACPSLISSMDINALNYCRFSLLRHWHDPMTWSKSSLHDNNIQTALIALPNLIDSSIADIWQLPERERIHAAIGQELHKPIFSPEPSSRNKSGIIMSMHLFYVHSEAESSSSKSYATGLRLLCAYENGSVTLRRYGRTDKSVSVEGKGWDTIWTSKLHVESIMAMAVSKDNSFALTVSADHIIGRYGLSASNTPADVHGVTYRTKHPGNGAIAIRDDGKVCAVGGWDGNIRLYSTKSLKPLGTLQYHKTACQCVLFARSLVTEDNQNTFADCNDNDDDSEDDDVTPTDKAERSRWLIAGGKDCRVSIWSLISFSSKPPDHV